MNLASLHFEIGGNGLGVLTLDGEPLRGVTGFTITSKATHVPQVTLEVRTPGGLDGNLEAFVDLDAGAIRTLIALGWTPPPGTPGTLEALEAGEQYVVPPKVESLAHRREGGHWLVFDSGQDGGPVAGCHCGFDADLAADAGWGDSVLDHFETVVRAEERTR